MAMTEDGDVLTCCDCTQQFLYSNAERAWMEATGTRETGTPWPPPTRCRACRAKRKAERAAMGLFPQRHARRPLTIQYGD